MSGENLTDSYSDEKGESAIETRASMNVGDRNLLNSGLEFAIQVQEHHFVDRACGGIRDAWVADDDGQTFGPRDPDVDSGAVEDEL